MLVTLSKQIDHEKRNSDRDSLTPPAPAITETMQHVTIFGLAFDALWHHRLRRHYIGHPKTLHTCGIYAFWAAVWYCATKSGDWAHAAIAKDRNNFMLKIAAAQLPAYNGIRAHDEAPTAYRTRSLPRVIEAMHFVACCSLTTVPVLVRLTCAYRPWFWQRRLPFKMIWLCGAAYTSCVSLGGCISLAYSRSRLREGHGSEYVQDE